MFSFLAEFTRDLGRSRTVIVMDADGLDRPRTYHVWPHRLLLGWGASALMLALLVLVSIVFTPIRELIPGYGTEELQQEARLNSLRVRAMADTLAMQREYLNQLRHVMLGEPDSSFAVRSRPPEPAFAVSGDLADVAADPLSENWSDHRQPAVSLDRLPSGSTAAPTMVATSVGERYISGLRFPVLPPVEGYLSRGFDARTGHFAVDIAVEEGSMVRSIGDGHVIFGDWTHEGGFTLAIQHADGFVSVYKHNQRLLKRLGDRVHDRETIAVSGNSGEVTTGPHLHFEIWHNGLAQDPRLYLIGL